MKLTLFRGEMFGSAFSAFTNLDCIIPWWNYWVGILCLCPTDIVDYLVVQLLSLHRPAVPSCVGCSWSLVCEGYLFIGGLLPSSSMNVWFLRFLPSYVGYTAFQFSIVTKIHYSYDQCSNLPLFAKPIFGARMARTFSSYRCSPYYRSLSIFRDCVKYRKSVVLLYLFYFSFWFQFLTIPFCVLA